MKTISGEKQHATVLVVDDTRENLRLLSGILNEQGYAVRLAPDGRLAIASTQANPPDLILLDIMMPGMDGYAVCEKLKADARTEHVPIIFISALHEVFDKVKAFSVGGVDYITKPFQVEEVLARVRNQLTIRALYQQLEEANAQLEQRVRERTNELAEAYNNLVSLQRASERFVPRECFELMHKENISKAQLGDFIAQDMTVMVAGIRAFTSLSEHMDASEHLNFINSYLSRVSPPIRHNDGFIERYRDNAILALFPYQADDALQATLAVLEEVELYNIYRQEQGDTPIAIGAGLDTGHLVMGFIGEGQRMQSTIISDTTTKATYMEELSRLYGASIVISTQTYDALENQSKYRIRQLGTFTYKKGEKPLSLIEVFNGEEESLADLKEQTRTLFEKGLHLYTTQHFTDASECFTKVLEQNPSDKAARLYVEWSTHGTAHGTPPPWLENMVAVCLSFDK